MIMAAEVCLDLVFFQKFYKSVPDFWKSVQRRVPVKSLWKERLMAYYDYCLITVIFQIIFKPQKLLLRYSVFITDLLSIYEYQMEIIFRYGVVGSVQSNVF